MRIFLNGAMSVILLAAASLSSCTSAASLERQAFRNYKTPLPYSPATGNQATGLPVDTNTDQLIDDGTLQVHRLVVLAETRSPKLLAAYKRWQAAVYGITTATALPDATLSYAEFIDSLETRLGPIERRFALDQKIPFFPFLFFFDLIFPSPFESQVVFASLHVYSLKLTIHNRFDVS